MSLHVRTVVLDDDRPLLEHLPDVPDDARFAFVREGEGLVAWGVAHDLPVGTGDGRLSDAAAALRDLATRSDVDDPVALPGSGLIAFGSFTFDPAQQGSVLRVPSVIIGRRGGVTWRTEIGTTSGAGAQAGAQAGENDGSQVGDSVPRDGDAPDAPVADRTRYAGSTLDDTRWLEAVAQALTEIEASHAAAAPGALGTLEKVVLARDVHLWSRSPFDTRQVLAALEQRFPSCFTFLVDHLVGASPELLLRVDGDRLASRVLAGTAPRGEDAAEDERLAAALLASEKDRWEHDLAARSAVEVLGPLCDDLVMPGGPSVVPLDNVQHLGSDLRGTLRAPQHVLDLLDALHPTAAVAGTPRDVALERIRALEGMDRGRYAGPVGWCSPDGDGEFAIALRCGELRGTRARLFAGAGIVAGSLPEAELTETWLKLRAMTDVLTKR